METKDLTTGSGAGSGTGSSRACCPLCHHSLVPVHAAEGGVRRVLYHACPGPYCEFVMLRERPPAALPRQATEGHTLAS